MRELVAFLDKSWAEGEIIIDTYLHISIGLMTGTFLLGILPLIHPNGANYLGLLKLGIPWNNRWSFFSVDSSSR